MPPIAAQQSPPPAQQEGLPERRSVLVTGGAGFIGSHLVHQLHERGWRVRVLDLPAAKSDHLPASVEVLSGDVRNARQVAQAVRGCEVVVHLAANPNLWCRNAAEFDQVNHLGTRNVLEAALAADAGRIVHVSTESILTHRRCDRVIDEQVLPDLSQAAGPYCRSKARAELAAIEMAQRGGPIIVVSPTVPVGPGDWHQGPLTRLISQFLEGRIKAVMDAEISLIDVRDVAHGIVRAVEAGSIGHRYLLAAENWTVPRIFDVLGELSGRSVPTLRVPYPVALAFAWIEEQACARLDRIPLATVTGVRLARRRQRFDGARSQVELGLRYRACRDAIAETVEWLGCGGMVPVAQSS